VSPFFGYLLLGALAWSASVYCALNTVRAIHCSLTRGNLIARDGFATATSALSLMLILIGLVSFSWFKLGSLVLSILSLPFFHAANDLYLPSGSLQQSFALVILPRLFELFWLLAAMTLTFAPGKRLFAWAKRLSDAPIECTPSRLSIVLLLGVAVHLQYQVLSLGQQFTLWLIRIFPSPSFQITVSAVVLSNIVVLIFLILLWRWSAHQFSGA